MDFSSLISYLDKCNIKYQTNIKTASLVSIKVGGFASIVAYPDTIENLCNILKLVYGKYKYYLLANGTNTYFCDYYEGIIISTKNLNKIEILKDEIISECGASLTGCAVYAYENGLTGLEFAYGIPGSVGGGVYMNASAYNGKMSDIVKECVVYDVEKDSLFTLTNKKIKFSDKYSIFMKENLVILNVKLNLNTDNKCKIKEKMNTYMQRRTSSQPLSLPSAGSAFKRPQGNYASRLIDEAGLKGYRIGDAQVSEKHAGFIVNKGNASANDIQNLIRHIKTEIKNKFNINLEEEIIFVE